MLADRVYRERRRCINVITRRKESLVRMNDRDGSLFVRFALVLEIRALTEKITMLENMYARLCAIRDAKKARVMVIGTIDYVIYQMPDGRLIPFGNHGHLMTRDMLTVSPFNWATWTPAEMMENIGGIGNVLYYLELA